MSGPLNISQMLLLLFALLGCIGKDPVQQELLVLRDNTIVTPTEIVEQSHLISDGLARSAVWVFETESDWDTYSKAVQHSLPSYKATMSEPRQMQLRRQLAGDVFVVDIHEPSTNSRCFLCLSKLSTR